MHPRRIGQSIGGVEVRDREDWTSKESPVMLGAVGLEGQRGILASMAADRGYVEGEDHLGTPVSHGCIRVGEKDARSRCHC